MTGHALNILNYGEDHRKRVASGFPLNYHICHFYDTKESLLELLVPYFAEGLEQDEFCLWGVGHPLTVESAGAALAQAVGGRVAEYVRRGQLEIFDVTKLYGNGVFDAMAVKDAFLKKVFASLSQGWTRFRCDGMASSVTPANWTNYQTYEYEITRSASAPVTALCSYDITKLKLEQIVKVASTHQVSVVKRNGRWVAIESHEHLALLKAQFHESR